jgi:hypothetical protein
MPRFKRGMTTRDTTPPSRGMFRLSFALSVTSEK